MSSLFLPLVVALCSLATFCAAAEPPITSVTFSPDGRSVVTCSQAGIAVYRWPQLELRTRIEPLSPNVHDVAFSPRGDRFAVAGGTPTEDGTVEIFSWPQGRSLRVLDGHLDSVMAVCWLDDSTIASGGLDHQVLIWNTESGKIVRRLKGHSRGVTSLAFFDGKGILVSTGIDQSLRVWETGTGKLLRSMAIHVRPVSSVSPRPTGDGLPMIASASDDRTVRFWQPTIGRMVRFARLPSPPRDVKWSPEGLNAIACCEDGHVYMIDPETVEVIGDVQALSGWAYTIAVHPEDGAIVVAGSDGVIRRVEFPLTR